MPTRTESIKKLLQAFAPEDLAESYYIGMECQVNVAQGSGEVEVGEYMGKKWKGYTDGLTTWKAFRIPYKANSEPEYEDRRMTFDLSKHAEGIGMTGWDWMKRASSWVAYDFDSLINHKEGLTHLELEEIIASVKSIPWIGIRYSTSGTGYHLYVKLNDISTENHTEHAALARSILGKMSALVGIDFQSKVDTCGGNMWVWHRKMTGTNGLTILKDSEPLEEIPENWKEHLTVIKGTARRSRMGLGDSSSIDDIASQRNDVELDDEHKKLINYLEEEESCSWWWDADRSMLVTSTIHLEAAHKGLNHKGIFKTNSSGSSEQNCFCFPMRLGSWAVRRYSPGVQEDASWHQDAGGWTKCFYNRDPDLRTACRACGALENEKGEFVFREAESAVKAALLLGVNLSIDPKFHGRTCTMKRAKDGRLVINFEKQEGDNLTDAMAQDWLPNKKQYTQVVGVKLQAQEESEVENYDDLVRHIVVDGGDQGWVIKSDGIWRNEPFTHAKLGLKAQGISGADTDIILGSSVFKPWKLVNKPFQEEYPGDREWNRFAAQIKYARILEDKELSYPTWQKILTHCGSGLDHAVSEDGWCKSNGILTGSDYLKCWVASLFQHPTEPLPYLFFYGPQDSGKSIFHEGIELLLTKGCQKADLALTSSSGFNGELEGAILCVVEEVDLSASKQAYNRIKDWVTSRQLNIRHLHRNPYHVTNCTHWVQCANDPAYCPVFTGDTRITMAFVDALDPMDMIPKKQMILQLQKEAPEFVTAVLKLEIPKTNSRLNIPIVSTSDKAAVQSQNRTELEAFIDGECTLKAGESLTLGEFWARFQESLAPNEISNWTKTKMARKLPAGIPKGRSLKDNSVTLGNIKWKIDPDVTEGTEKFVLKADGKLALIPV